MTTEGDCIDFMLLPPPTHRVLDLLLNGYYLDDCSIAVLKQSNFSFPKFLDPADLFLET